MSLLLFLLLLLLFFFLFPILLLFLLQKNYLIAWYNSHSQILPLVLRTTLRPFAGGALGSIHKCAPTRIHTHSHTPACSQIYWLLKKLQTDRHINIVQTKNREQPCRTFCGPGLGSTNDWYIINITKTVIALSIFVVQTCFTSQNITLIMTIPKTYVKFL